MMLALIRPDSWNFPLFLHILGATVLFGTVATVAIAGFASRSHAGYEQLLARVAARTFLFGVIPSFILMRAGAQWIVGKEFPGDAKTPGWIDVGFIVSEPGALLLLITGILIWLRPPRPADAGRAGARRDLRGRSRRRVGRDVRQALAQNDHELRRYPAARSRPSVGPRRPQSGARSQFIFSR